jgi:hypothetical protein
MKLSQHHNKSKTCDGQYHHDTTAVAPPCTAEAMALAASCLPISFLYLLHHMSEDVIAELYGSVALPLWLRLQGKFACLSLFLLTTVVHHLVQLRQSCSFLLDLLPPC